MRFSPFKLLVNTTEYSAMIIKTFGVMLHIALQTFLTPFKYDLSNAGLGYIYRQIIISILLTTEGTRLPCVVNKMVDRFQNVLCPHVIQSLTTGNVQAHGSWYRNIY